MSNPVQTGRQVISDLSELRVTPRGSSQSVRLADHVSGFVNVRSYGAKGDGVTDDTAAIQAAIDTYTAAGAAGVVYLPAGRYRITSTIYARAHVTLRGAKSDTSATGAPATELAWYGPDGGTAVITAQDDNTDWSRAGIEGIQIRNYATMTTGWGLKVRNPQNSAYLRNVKVMGFPTRGILVYEPAGRTGATVGATPGAFFMEGVYVSSGAVSLEVQTGAQPIEIRQLIVGVDSTCTKGVLFTKGPNAPAQATPIVVMSSAIEIVANGPDVHGFEWDSDLAITFIGCAVQRDDANGANLSTKAAFYYSYTTRSLPTVDLVGCTSWKMRYMYQFERSGIAAAPASRDTAESCTWTRVRTDAQLAFTLPNVAAGLSMSPAYASGDPLAGQLGYLATRPGTVCGIAAVYTGTINTAAPHDITAGVYINGTLVGTVHIASTSPTVPGVVSANGRRDWHDFTAGNEIQPWYNFAAGDLVQVKVTTGASFAPAGGHLAAAVSVRFR
jgi:hypothetical protein